MQITRSALASLDMEMMRPYVRDSEWFYAPAGKEHYRLLAHLSTQFEGRVLIDVGTHRGDSAHALAYNPANTVISFDVEDRLPEHRRQRANIRYVEADLWGPDARVQWEREILGSAVILVDIDPHEGTRELEFVEWLHDHDYGGLIVLDDVWHFKPMRDRLWSQIESRHKIDATRLGHWSGTGIVSFGSTKIEIKGSVDTSNWTLVTGYFDLTQMPDATPEIKARPPRHYLDQHAQGTLGLDENIVVYCEPDRINQIWNLRPRHLHARTRVVPMVFDDFPLTKYRDQILKNRGGTCKSDSRNTASYYLFCMARYAMLGRTLIDNPFDSTHFGWINICLERMGSSNLAHLHEALACQRDRFSTTFIDYVTRSFVSDPVAYFGGDRCVGKTSFCSGFFTGGRDAMAEVCARMTDAFHQYLRAGHGHADEQLMARVYHDSPELFDWYIGDYQEMVTNYAQVYENPGAPLRNLIPHSYAQGDRFVCARACQLLYRSYLSGACQLSDVDLATLLHFRELSADTAGALYASAEDTRKT